MQENIFDSMDKLPCLPEFKIKYNKMKFKELV